jgi:hypothetical protein
VPTCSIWWAPSSRAPRRRSRWEGQTLTEEPHSSASEGLRCCVESDRIHKSHQMAAASFAGLRGALECLRAHPPCPGTRNVRHRCRRRIRPTYCRRSDLPPGRTRKLHSHCKRWPVPPTTAYDHQVDVLHGGVIPRCCKRRVHGTSRWLCDKSLHGKLPAPSQTRATKGVAANSAP